MIKRYLSMALLITPALSLLAQQNELAVFIQEKKTENFIMYKSDNPLTADQLIRFYKNELGLSTQDELQLATKTVDQLDFTHYRYQQYSNGIEVYGAQYLVHEKLGTVRSSNGKPVGGIATAQAGISADQALQNALDFVGAKTYMWELSEEEQLLKRIKEDAHASYFPKSKLVYFDKYFTAIGSNYRLAYQFEIYAKSPLSKKDVFVDAMTGQILHAIDKIHTTEVTGSANTKYAGVQSIQTDSVASNSYRLREFARGGGIETYNMLQGTNYGAAVDFTDTDNIWNNVNIQQDEAATDAHWAAEMTYDYYMLKHGRNSFDNAGTKLLSYVHYDANYSNAFWDGVRMSYGDGDGTNYTALTSLDVGGHEITHGVTEYSANLVYQNESGALNESFSDIFGTAIEFYADPGNGDWFIGEDFDINGNGFRSMSDPNSVGDPDTYLGNNWEFTAVDNGGVHTNSSVQNYWFYLLSVGGSGTNDNNDSYNVTGIGMDSAAAIAYRNLTVYLTQSSEYWDARVGAIQAAEDLYGTCSNAVIETSKAWAAVGVGFPIEDNDLMLISIESPATACGLTNAENVTVKIRNNGCLVDLMTGDTIDVYYKVDANPVVMETITLASNFNAGDTLTYTFTTPADLSTIGMHTVSSWVSYHLDPQLVNDSISGLQIENKVQQNVDMAMLGVISPESGCHLSASESVTVAVQFLGCDSLPQGTNVGVAYQLNGGTIVSETIVLPNTLFAEDTLNYTFTGTANFSTNGLHTIDAWTAYGLDNMNTNDTLLGTIIKHPFPLFETDTVTFENNTAVLDTMILTDNIESSASVSNASAVGNYALRLTGGDPLNSGIIPDLDSNNFWGKNMEFAAFAKFCVDASSMSAVYMQFDLRQTLSMVYNFQFGQPVPEASSLRVTVNGTQVSNNYHPVTESSDPFTKRGIDLSAYAGTQFEVVFESRMGFSKAADPLALIGSEGDNAYIDNVLFTQTPVPVGQEELAVTELLEYYPNPTEGLLNFTFNAAQNENLAVAVYDVLGNLVQQTKKNIMNGVNRFQLDLTDQSKGVYFVKLQSAGLNKTVRVVKQ
ncbi:MAG: M4 family metallopeptidase [Flavobacteriales bacterium]|nr:M4 family metallopeptidase [Flavobacteriales bacterium]